MACPLRKFRSGGTFAIRLEIRQQGLDYCDHLITNRLNGTVCSVADLGEAALFDDGGGSFAGVKHFGENLLRGGTADFAAIQTRQSEFGETLGREFQSSVPVRVSGQSISRADC